MKEERQKLILNGNEFYELDLECLKQKKQDENRLPKTRTNENTSYAHRKKK